MKLSDVCREEFEKKIRSRGEEYAGSRRVKILSANERQIIAEVRGSVGCIYDVEITMDPEDVLIDCTCPYFESEGACKHLWATIITAEKNGFQSNFLTDDSVVFEKKLMDEDYMDEDEEWNFLKFDKNHFSELNNYLENDISAAKRQNLEKFTKMGSSFHECKPDWKSLFAVDDLLSSPITLGTRSGASGEIYYVIDGKNRVESNGLLVGVKTRKCKKNGEPGKAYNYNLYSHTVDRIKDKIDQQITTLLLGTDSYYSSRGNTFRLKQSLAELVFPLILETKRCSIILAKTGEELFLTYDSSKVWKFSLSMEPDKDGYLLKPYLSSGDEIRDLDEAVHISCSGYLSWSDGTVNRLNAYGLHSWIQRFDQGTYQIPSSDAAQFVRYFKGLSNGPPFSYPKELDTKEIEVKPTAVFRIEGECEWRNTEMVGALVFSYDQNEIILNDVVRIVYDSDNGTFYKVDYQFHKECFDLLLTLGVTDDSWNSNGPLLTFKKKDYYRLVSVLLSSGWKVEGKDIQFKQPGNFSFSVKSGIDWFEVEGKCEYDGKKISLPKILEAIKKKKEYVELGDGGVGLLPTEWLEKYGRLAALGTAEDDSIRFGKSQTLLVDLLLAEQPDVNCDKMFTSIRDSLRDFNGVVAEKAGEGFVGILRNYQQEGLGWLSFLNHFGFGGCLADDMGLGKTVQVLAVLEKERMVAEKTSKKRKGATKSASAKKMPSLVVAPRSLIYNWYNEANSFTPQLKVLDHSHSQRTEDKVEFSDYDLVLVTYGTLRRDIKELKEVRFNYVILDEAQAIKNATTVTAKATRLLNSKNRLALSGTPVENHLGDLWSIFEFLNPGMLGAASVFKGTSKSTSPDESECELLRKALRPFILRRTKSQVAKDLPQKTEELIVCEMEPGQKKIYNQLKRYYQASLKTQIEKSGLKRSKIQILEALLRLRQAACHPGLIEKKNLTVASTKLDSLIESLLELRQEGHKSLVFSQFTSMLAIIGDRLKMGGINYEYLDGRSRKRQQIIDRFQNDPDCSTFLISLKAGGVGLNLTAADYVFIFDPWWNPAAEMQAIDRTHRIGQTKPVFAYRLICKDTVEEKIVELQRSKRSLAESVISTDESVLSSITSQDLELLLS